MKKILIIGATGYLGKYIANTFLKEGNKLVIICRNSSNIYDFLNNQYVEILYSDDLLISQKIQELDIDIFINAAVDYGRNNSFFGVFKTNVHLPLFIIDNLKNPEKILFISFDSFYTKNEFKRFKTLPFYVISKVHLNEWLENLNDSKKVTVIILRIEHLIGKDEKLNKFNGWIIDQCKNNNGVIRLTKGNQVRDFIYVEDIVTAVLIIIKNESQFKRKFNLIEIGTGRGYTIRHFIETIHTLTQSKAKLDFGSIPFKKNEIMKSIADNHVLKNLGWSPLDNLDLIIKKVI